MNIIQKQKQLIDQLQAENAILKAEKAKTDADIKTLAKSVKIAWESMGIDIETFKTKSKALAIPMILAKVAKKEVQNTLQTEWAKVSEILKEYNHLTQEE